MQDHLTADVFQRLVERRCHISLAYGWLLHLLACETCRTRLVQVLPDEGERFLREIFRTQQPVSMPELGEPETVDRILAHLKSDGISSFLETRPLPDYLHTLPDQPEGRQAWAVRNSRRLQDPAVVEHLLSQCQSLWFQDAERAVRLAKLALRILDHLSVNVIHPKILSDLRFEAWGKLGNSLRILGRYRGAREALRTARELWNECVCTPSLRTSHLYYEAKYQRDCGRPELSVELVRRAEAVQRDDESTANRLSNVTLTTNGLRQLGRLGEARQRVETGLENLSTEDVGAVFYAGLLDNLALTLIADRLILPAWSVLRERDRFTQGAGKVVRFRMMWTDAYFYERAGDLAAAEELYRAVLQRAEKLSLEHDQGSALADLTRVLIRKDHRRAAREVADEAIDRLTRLGVERQATEVRNMIEGGPLVMPW
jgi:tetratricopeptide (TPR) repeat protein